MVTEAAEKGGASSSPGGYEGYIPASWKHYVPSMGKGGSSGPDALVAAQGAPSDISQYQKAGGEYQSAGKDATSKDFKDYVPESWQKYVPATAGAGQDAKDGARAPEALLAKGAQKAGGDASGKDYEHYVPESWQKYVPTMGGEAKDDKAAKGKHTEGLAVSFAAEPAAAKAPTERDLEKEERAAEDASRAAARKQAEQLRADEEAARKRAREAEEALKTRAQQAEAAVAAKARADP